MTIDRLTVALALASGCAGTLGGQHRDGFRHADRIAFGLASIAIACDWGLTHYEAVQEWPVSGPGEPRRRERNPLLGLWPSSADVDAYFVSVAALHTIAWLLLPERWRTVLSGTVLAFEASAFRTTYVLGYGVPVCGI